MLRLPKFEYLSPRSLEDANSLIIEYENRIKPLAGGTDLLPLMKDRLFTPEYVLDLKKISGLNEIKVSPDEELKIGSLSTITVIEKSQVIIEYFPGLAEAAGLVGTPALRNMGTIGGNIALETRCYYYNKSHSWRKSLGKCIKLGGNVCHVVKGAKNCRACFVADTVPALIAFDAQVTILGTEGLRQYPLREIYTQDGKYPNRLKPTDIVTGLVLSLRNGTSGSSYKKLRLRKAIDFGLVGVAANVIVEGGAFRNAKIVLGAVGSGPVEVTEAEDFLRGKSVSDEVLEEVGEITQRAAHPVANMESTPAYRRKMVKAFTKIALKEAIKRAEAKAK